MIENITKFKLFVAECNITEPQLQEILTKYHLGDIYEDEIKDDSNFDVSSTSEFEYHIQNGNISDITKITDDMIQFISLTDFYATTEHEFILEAYYSKHKHLPVDLIHPDNRAWVYDYLTKTHNRKSITFGLCQEWDIERLLDGQAPDKNLDFRNWDSRHQMSIFDNSELRFKLLHHICEMFKMNLVYDEFYPVFQEILSNHSGFDILNIANSYGDNILKSVIECIICNGNMRNINVMKTLTEYYIYNDHVVYNLVMSMSGSTEYEFPAQYVNFESVERYVKNANMHIKNKSANVSAIEYVQEELNAFIRTYLRRTTNVHDSKIELQFTTSAGFTMHPLMYRLKHLITRYKNTSEINPGDLLKCEIQKYDYQNLVEFMLMHLNEQHIETLIKEDTWHEFDIFRNDRLRRKDTIELIKKFPDLIVYYTLGD